LSNVQNDHAVWAVFGPDMVPLTISAGANGSIAPASAPGPLNGPGVAFVVPLGGIRSASATVHDIAYGSSETFNILPELGYHIEDVLVNDVSVGPVYSYTFEDVTVGHSISAVFARNTYTVTPTTVGPGTISPSTPQSVNYGGSKTFTITPSANYHIEDVKLNGQSVGAVYSVDVTNVTNDETVTATFAPTPPAATSVSRPSVSPSTPKKGKPTTFTSRLTPSAAVAEGSTKLTLLHRETRTVRKKVGGKWKKVKQTYWHSRAEKTMTAAADGKLTLRYKLPYKGSWKMTATYSGSGGYAPSGSTSRQFTVK
jgi:hypothetical protein